MAVNAKQYNKQIFDGSEVKGEDGQILSFTSGGFSYVPTSNNPYEVTTNSSANGIYLATATNSRIKGLGSYANDAAASAGSVDVGAWYINSGTGAVQQRLV